MSTAKLIIRDEVNIKIEGLDISLRKRLATKFKFKIPGAQFTPAVRLGRWDGTMSFFQLGGSTYLNLLPDFIDDLVSDRYEF